VEATPTITTRMVPQTAVTLVEDMADLETIPMILQIVVEEDTADLETIRRTVAEEGMVDLETITTGITILDLEETKAAVAEDTVARTITLTDPATTTTITAPLIPMVLKAVVVEAEIITGLRTTARMDLEGRIPDRIAMALTRTHLLQGTTTPMDLEETTRAGQIATALETRAGRIAMVLETTRADQIATALEIARLQTLTDRATTTTNPPTTLPQAAVTIAETTNRIGLTMVSSKQLGRSDTIWMKIQPTRLAMG